MACVRSYGYGYGLQSFEHVLFVELSLPLYASLTRFRGMRMHVHFVFTVQSQ